MDCEAARRGFRLNTVQYPGLAEAQRRAEADALFAADSYADWTRGALRARAADPDLAILFDSTISEPLEELSEVARAAFSPMLTSRYVSVFADGNPYAVQALARRYGLNPSQILTTTGATGALNLVLRALLKAGDEILVETPGFDIHSRMAAEIGARVTMVERPAPVFRIDPDAVRARLTPRTRLLLITNLHNPSGAYLPPAEIATLAAALAPAGVVLVVDEVYADFAADDGAPPAALLGANVITVSSLTKVWGLFGLKFGWLAAAPELIEAIKAGAPEGDMGVSKLSHAVAAHVLEAPAPFEAHWRRTLAQTRPLVARAAETMRRSGVIEGETPEFGCMYFPRIVGVEDTRGLARRLFEQHRVLVAPGEYFGAPGHLRIGFGADAAMIATGLERLEAGLHALR